MDSEDEYDEALVGALEESLSKEEIFTEEMIEKLEEGMGCLNFELPESLTTEGYGERTPGEPLVADTRTAEKMKLVSLSMEKDEVLTTMLGDFSDIEQFMEPISKNEDLKKVVLKHGLGLTVMTGDVVSVHYIFSCEFMDDLIESTYGNKRLPKRFRVGEKEVLPILELGVQTMRVGETAKFLGTSDYAFGDYGIPLEETFVPGGSRALMQVEVLSKRTPEVNHDLVHFSTKERQHMTFEVLYKHINEFKIRGNEDFKKKAWQKALTKYLEALDACRDFTYTDGNETVQKRELTYQILNNVALTLAKMDSHQRALRYAKAAVKVDIKPELKGKAYYRCASACYELGKFENCLKYLKQIDAGSAANSDVKLLRMKVEDKLIVDKLAARELYQRMMK